jgi:tRNA threonylcarbamoyladenosine biosynthesis protein TsaB
MLLALDTATQNLSIALHNGDELLYEQTWRSSNQHTVQLAPAVETALERIDHAPITALAVSIGPGTYTGLRVGVSFAKAMASALEVPLVGMTTLDILAAAQPQTGSALVAVVQAGRGRIVAASYQWRKGRWKRRAEPQAMSWETLLATIDGAAIISGEVDADGREKVAQAKAVGIPVTLAPGTVRLRRAGFLAEEAWAMLRDHQSASAEDGQPVDPYAFSPSRVIPLYIKTKDSP